MIKLENLEKKDLNKILDWNINKSPDYLLQWAGPTYNYPLTLSQLEDSFLNDSKKYDCNILFYKIVLTNTNEMIGSLELRTDKTNKVGRICRFLIGQENLRGKRIGTQSLKEILRIGFQDLNLEKITLGVFDFNQSAIKCYENAGFIKEKFTENARRSSTGYWSLYEMGISKKQWELNN